MYMDNAEGRISDGRLSRVVSDLEKEAGSVGGQIARKMGPVRTARYERYNLISTGHVQIGQYITAFTT